MCTYQTLYHNAREGYVIHCRQCNHLQTGFGNICITLSRQGFLSFLQYLRECLTIADKDLDVKTFRIPTPYDGMHLLLTGGEIKRLVSMLDEAETEWRSLALLELFRQGTGDERGE